MTRQRYSETSNFATCRSNFPPTSLRLKGVAWGLLLSLLCMGCRTADAQSESSAGELLQQAEQLLAEQEYARAAKLADQAGMSTPDAYRVQQLSAEILYRAGASKDSLKFFDRALELAPDRAPYNWQRGIALGSSGKFQEGAEQFKTHHDVNPDDVENSAWYFLCVAKSQSLEAARKTVIPSRGDGRQPMMSILQMLQGKLEPEQVLSAAQEATPVGPQRKLAEFYADLYVGLYYDSLNNPEQAQTYLKRSLTYGIDGYMADTARVYLADRFPDAISKPQPGAK
ncbi:hypothetical protein [Aureliella helgolandensis]|uniref:Lipoprotein NlpI n=1 Tax=Aureliella helgolandensis TaxID=2527968 RepID=A0A518G0S9_9BACT|nr:hypothetical protein [Aureliella helgolandensis]QDV22140.1 lipoprotein NlpI [Aureliella helgolandensis]